MYQQILQETIQNDESEKITMLMKSYSLIIICVLNALCALGESRNPYYMMGCNTPVLDYTEPSNSPSQVTEVTLPDGTKARLKEDPTTKSIVILAENNDTLTTFTNDGLSVLRFLSIDKLAEETPGVSPYAYCNGDPINAIDPDGNRVLLVNGYWISGFIGDWIGSPVGGKDYWGTGFTNAACSFFNDYSVIDASYIDGSSMFGGDMSGGDRYRAGYAYANANISALTAGMAPDEAFNMVTHSEGSAYGAGVAAALIDNGYVVNKVVHLSADEGDEFSTPTQPFTIQLSYNKDWVTNNHQIKRTDISGIICKGNLSALEVHGKTKGSSVFNALRDLLRIAFEYHIGQFNGQYRTWKSQIPSPHGTDFYMYNGNVILNFDGTPKY